MGSLVYDPNGSRNSDWYMTINSNRSTLEYDKFVESAEGDVAVRVLPGAGWASEAVGRNIQVTYPSGTTEVYTYRQDSTTLFEITVTYTDSNKTDLLSVERTA